MTTDVEEVVKLIKDQGEQINARFRGLEQDIAARNRPGAEYTGESDPVTAPKVGVPVLSATFSPCHAISGALSTLASDNVPFSIGMVRQPARERTIDARRLSIHSADSPPPTVYPPAGSLLIAKSLRSAASSFASSARPPSTIPRRTRPRFGRSVFVSSAASESRCDNTGTDFFVFTSKNCSCFALNLSAKTAVCLVKLSLELSQDSANIEQILTSTITSAMANAIDSAGLVGVTTGASAAPAGVMNLAGRNSVTSIGAPTSWDFLTDGMYELMLDNVPMENIGAFIAHPAVYKKMRKLKTGITSDNTPLLAPAEVAALPKLWTTAAPLTGGTTASGIIADWRDLIFGVRKDINVRIISESLMGSNLQIGLLAYARVDFAATRAQSFCTLEGITV